VASDFAAGGGVAWSKRAAPTTNMAISDRRLCMTALKPDFNSPASDREWDWAF